MFRTHTRYILRQKVLLPFVSILMFSIWFLGRSSVSFLDDIYFNFQNLTNAFTPIEFFNPNSPLFKAWPLLASLVWVLAKLGLNSIMTVKIFCLLVHIANTFLIRSLLRRHSLPLTLAYFLHPAMYLSLSWAWQLGTLFSLFLVLVSLNFFVRRNWIFDLGGAFFLTLSLLVKPWALLLLPYFFLITAFRMRGKYRQLAGLFSIGTIVVIIAIRAWMFGGPGLSSFPVEQDSRVEFENGLLQQSLDMSSSAAKYTAMALGIKTSIVEPRESQFSFLSAIGFGIIAMVLAILIIQLRSRHSTLAIVVLLAGWLPHSGLIYLPHFKFSFISPHYFSLMLPGVVLCLDAFLNEFKGKWINYALLALVCFFGIKQTDLYWRLNHDTEFQKKATPVLISP